MVRIIFPSVNESKQILTASDNYMESLTVADYKVRLGENLSDSPYEDYCHLLEQCIVIFTPFEQQTIRESVEVIFETIKKADYIFEIPDQLVFIKTDGSDESDCSYCRHDNVIVLIEQHISSQKTIAHEIFHVLSRNNPEIRNKLYEVIDYYFDPDLVATLLNQLANIHPEKTITNPDCPVIDVYVNLSHERLGVPITYWEKEWPTEKSTHWIYTDCYTTKLAIFEKDEKDDKKEWRLSKLSSYDEVAIEEEKFQYMNTDYLEHPEEIMADNFALLIMQYMYPDKPRRLYNDDLLIQLEAVMRE